MPQREISIDLRPIQGHGLDLDQYFGLWAVEDSRFLQMLEHVARTDLAAHVTLHAADPAPAAAVRRAETSGQQIAVISIEGSLTKRGSSFGAGSLVRARQAIREAARDPDIGGIMLVIDSPGGTVAGTADLAREVAQAKSRKPVHAFVEDLCASAAYWVASQCDRVAANDATALVGSIGTYVALYDYSAMAAKEGIKAVVIRAGAFKGAGTPGTEITDDQRAYWQEIVDKTQAEFSAGVAAGRGLPAARVAELADGRVHVAGDALKLQLIDAVQSLDAALAELSQTILKRSRSKTMSQTETAPQTKQENQQPATLAELKTALVGASADFLVEQLERGATLPQASQAWMAEQAKRIEAAQKATEEAKAAAKKPGVETLGAGKPAQKAAADETAGDPIAQWNEALAAKVKAGVPRSRAVSLLVAEEPELHKAYLAAYNAARGRQA
ncbi:MAG: signal peptide peptidase SppA [Planctomycetota bacterium]